MPARAGRQREHAQWGCFLGNNLAANETRFQWNKGDKIGNLIRCIANFKAKMEYNNGDFKADKVKQYDAIRETMAWIYEDESTSLGRLSSHHYQRHQTSDRPRDG